MTAAATEPSLRLRCPRCGARLAPDQDWCLECGAAATTRVLRPPSWKLAAVVVLGVLAAVVVAVVLVVNSLSHDADRAVATRAARTAPTAASSTSAARTTPAASSRTTAATTPAAGATAARSLATWPQGRSAWTVVLATGSNRAAAERRARGLVAKGVPAGVLDTTRFDVAAPGAAFVVFSGQFPNQAAAVAGESRLRGKGSTSAFVAEVSPR